MAAEGTGFEESEHWYDHLEKHIGWTSIGKILCVHVTQPGDTDGKKNLWKRMNWENQFNKRKGRQKE